MYLVMLEPHLIATEHLAQILTASTCILSPEDCPQNHFPTQMVGQDEHSAPPPGIAPNQELMGEGYTYPSSLTPWGVTPRSVFFQSSQAPRGDQAQLPAPVGCLPILVPGLQSPVHVCQDHLPHK